MKPTKADLEKRLANLEKRLANLRGQYESLAKIESERRRVMLDDHDTMAGVVKRLHQLSEQADAVDETFLSEAIYDVAERLLDAMRRRNVVVCSK